MDALSPVCRSSAKTYAFRSESSSVSIEDLVVRNPPRARLLLSVGIHRLTGLGRQMINGSRLIEAQRSA